MDAAEAIPCPCCGSPAETQRHDAASYVFCSNEQCAKRPCTRAHPTDAQAVQAWNAGDTH